MKSEVRLIDANAATLSTYNNPYWTESEAAGVRSFLLHQPTIDPETLRPTGRWNIHCHSAYDSWTQETDEEFYLECSECKREVWNIDQSAAMGDEYRKLVEQYPYCHCGCKMMEG